jgi:cytochrome c oxidase cbb3-type subunit 4
MAELHAFVRSFWLVWLVLLFLGIVAWVYWPSHKKQLESYGRIPLQDDEDDTEQPGGR